LRKITNFKKEFFLIFLAEPNPAHVAGLGLASLRGWAGPNQPSHGHWPMPVTSLPFPCTRNTLRVHEQCER